MQPTFKGTKQIKVEHNSLFTQVSEMTVKLMSSTGWPRGGGVSVLMFVRSFLVLLHCLFACIALCQGAGHLRMMSINSA